MTLKWRGISDSIIKHKIYNILFEPPNFSDNELNATGMQYTKLTQDGYHKNNGQHQKTWKDE